MRSAATARHPAIHDGAASGATCVGRCRTRSSVNRRMDRPRQGLTHFPERPSKGACRSVAAHRATCSAFARIIAACARLRGLRNASGRALLKLWKGRTVEFDIDEAWLDELVEKLRQEVQVYEVEAVTLGEVP